MISTKILHPPSFKREGFFVRSKTMEKSAIFWIAAAIGAAGTSYEVWDGSNWIVTPALAFVGGLMVGWAVWFLWDKFMGMAKARDWW